MPTAKTIKSKKARIRFTAERLNGFVLWRETRSTTWVRGRGNCVNTVIVSTVAVDGLGLPHTITAIHGKDNHDTVPS